MGLKGRRFVHREGVSHLEAKQKLAGWLREVEMGAPAIEPFVWTAGNWGVHEELPFYEGSSPYYFEFPQGNRGRYLFVPDICVFHKGTPTLLIEIVDTSLVEPEKEERIREFFKDHLVEVWHISAQEVLSYQERPRRVSARCIIRT